MKFRSSLTGLIGAGLLAASAAGAVLAQDATGDANARSPGIVVIPIEGGEAHFVVGDMAWGDALGTLSQLQTQTEIPPDELAQRLWLARHDSPPLFMFELARMTVDSDPAFAIQAYFLGRVRTMYDAARCLDSSAIEIINEASAYAGEAIISVMAERPELTVAAIETILESGSAFSGGNSPWWACSFGSNAYFAAVNEQTLSGDEWLMVENRWPAIEARITANIQSNLEMMRATIVATDD
ncbi:hypothetical protein [Maricaulis sp.]|uniref:hypothetical protein n=1 Tax=Maricaulis sp. TaxID=1486257 RepID=UPI0025C03129|nr:hypothetical protein [Maricaulis sp.]